MEFERKAQMFSFKQGLYNISNKLTTSDVDKMKFMLSDFLPRQQLEKARSGFDLLCLMASREDLLSCKDCSFLEEVLREVGKADYIRGAFLPVSSLSPSMVLVNSVSLHQRPKLLQIKRFLGEIGDNLSTENVHDLCQFFAGICESINHQNLHHIKSAEQLFSRLQESHLVGVGRLQPLQQVLNLIGRLDLASSIEAFNAGTWQSSNQYPSLPTPEEQPSIPTPEEQDHERARGTCM